MSRIAGLMLLLGVAGADRDFCYLIRREGAP